jgi:hypothetical protein
MVRISLVPVLTPLYLYVSTVRSMCAVPNMAVFCSSLTSWFPGMLLAYFLNDFQVVPIAPVITGITFVLTFHNRWISIVRYLYFRIFSAYFLITFLSIEIATSINIHVLFLLSRIIMSGLLLGMVLSVWTCWFYSMVTLPSWPVSTDFGTCLYDCFCPIVPLFPYICWSVAVHTLYRVFLCTVLLPVWGTPILYGLLSHQTVGIDCICYLSLCLISSLSYYYYYYYYYYLRVMGTGSPSRGVNLPGWGVEHSPLLEPRLKKCRPVRQLLTSCRMNFINYFYIFRSLYPVYKNKLLGV